MKYYVEGKLFDTNQSSLILIWEAGKDLKGFLKNIINVYSALPEDAMGRIFSILNSFKNPEALRQFGEFPDGTGEIEAQKMFSEIEDMLEKAAAWEKKKGNELIQQTVLSILDKVKTDPIIIATMSAISKYGATPIMIEYLKKEIDRILKDYFAEFYLQHVSYELVSVIDSIAGLLLIDNIVEILKNKFGLTIEDTENHIAITNLLVEEISKVVGSSLSVQDVNGTIKADKKKWVNDMNMEKELGTIMLADFGEWFKMNPNKVANKYDAPIKEESKMVKDKTGDIVNQSPYRQEALLEGHLLEVTSGEMNVIHDDRYYRSKALDQALHHAKGTYGKKAVMDLADEFYNYINKDTVVDEKEEESNEPE